LNHLVDLDDILYGGDAIVGVDIKICVVDTLPAPFNLAQQWAGIV
jgi:hypothetical protein